VRWPAYDDNMWEVSGDKGGFQSVQPILVVPGNGNGKGNG